MKAILDQILRRVGRLSRRVRRVYQDQVINAPRPGFRTTTEGKVFIAVTFMIGFAAYNTGTNLLYLIFSMMLSLIVVSALMSRSTIKSVSVERLVPTHVVAGEEVLIHLTVRNHKRWFPSLSLRVADTLLNGKLLGMAYAVRIPAKGVIKTAYRAVFPRRGLYTFDRLVILTRYPFGFTEKSLSMPARQETLIFPPIVDLTSQFTEAQLDLGEIETGRRGLGTSLYGLRPYAPGDPARAIHWKVTAKAREIVVREFEREEKKRVTMHLDNVGNSGDSLVEEAFEWAVIFTASLAKYLIDRDYQVQLITHQGRVPFGTGISHLHRLLRSLAIVDLMSDNRPSLPFHAAQSADSTNLAIQFRDVTPPAGFDQVLDTRTWRPGGGFARAA